MPFFLEKSTLFWFIPRTLYVHNLLIIKWKWKTSLNEHIFNVFLINLLTCAACILFQLLCARLEPESLFWNAFMVLLLQSIILKNIQEND